MAGLHGRGTIMEHTGSRRERLTTTECFHWLTDAYRCFLTGSSPRQSAADMAGVIFCGVCGPVPGENRERAPAERCHENVVELTCMSVSLVEKMICLVSQSEPPEVTVYCGEALGLLFEHMDLMSQLVRQFQSEEHIISHLAAKSVSAYVVYNLQKSGTVNLVWQQKCVQTFHSSPPGPELDACLWSLTEVLKRLLKAAHQEILGKLLEAFDSSLCALCSKFLPDEREEVTQCPVDFTSSSHWGTTCCLLLDLLEALTASSLICDAGLKSQRLTHIHSSALLTTVRCSSQYFVKKRAMLLLKRAVLQKAGEDWALGDVPSTGLKYEHFSSDMNTLAETVLTAVVANWLETVQVESASFFGGTRNIQGDDGQKPDSVMLRAVSLLLLKSMELHIQTAQIAEVDCAIEVNGYLQSLWGFLRRCSVQLKEVTHLCSWVSLLFGEQDDDMMEAAKALLSIFLHHRRSSGLDDFTVVEAACASGCNPHCHFLLLLQSISFNHSILLDFLISTETCFLEYFVRYLKYLRADWQGFTAACERVSVSHCHLSLLETLTGSRGGDTSALAYEGAPDRVESSSCFQPTAVIPPGERVGLVSGLRLVEYDSSDESESESMEISEDAPGASAPPVFTRQRQYDSSDSAGLLSEPNSTLERRPGGLSLAVSQSEPTSCTNMAPVSRQVTCETLSRAVLCLSELRQVVTRLQMKKLFPYNPSSLLKLLAQVDNCSQQAHLSHLSQFNK
ncbi:protein Lines homolog 1 isoform X1 [Seriola aureovittata]|uniref:protein Lines homolog 1 isoform X1 n=1 Tax=Seriola aureovittata TaxID=2871759 RepID=UPI0024BE48DE|nr:protein Lines homolog 1 isoform X1 [Seriola aureovittata]